MKLTARQRELAARHLLAHPEEIAVCLRQRRWAELAALVEFATNDAPPEMAQTDPALYALLRQQITGFHVRGWSGLNLAVVKELADTESKGSRA
jgi:hypothetical protein